MAGMAHITEEARKNALYKKFDAFTGPYSASVILKDGKAVGRVIMKHLEATTCWVQVWGYEPACGRATGYGYDKATGAFEKACARLHTGTDDRDRAARQWMEEIKAACKNNGRTWRAALEEAGFTLAIAV